MNFIGKWEVSCLILNLMFYRIFTAMPGIFVTVSGPGAPLAALFSGVITLLIIWLLFILYKKSGYKSLPSLAEKYFGAVGKWAVSLALILYMVLSSAFMLGDFSRLVKLISFPAAPLWFVGLFFAAAALFAAIRGFDAIVRAHTVIVPFAVLLTLIVFVSVFRYGEWDNLFPPLGKGIESVAYGGIRGVLLFSDIILLFLINPFDNIKRVTLTASAAGVSIVVLLIVMFTLTNAFPQSETVEFPIYQLLKMVYYGRFFQRIDAIYMMAASLCGMLYLSFTFYLTARLAGALMPDRRRNL